VTAASAEPLATPEREFLQPDVGWMKKYVPVIEVARMLGMPIRHKRAQCWRPDNHMHGDADPSVRFLERENRVRCFVCDMRGGHSNVDMVMGYLRIEFADAVRWIAERFPVPSIRAGRPLGRKSGEPAPYRVGVHASDLEVLVRASCRRPKEAFS